MKKDQLIRMIVVGLATATMLWAGFFASCAPTDTTSDAATTDKAVADTAPADKAVTPTDQATVTDKASVDTGGKDEVTAPPDRATPDLGTPETSADKKPTSGAVWYGQVQSIVQQNCQVCHRAGGVGPFALTNYEEVKAKASIVEWSVTNARMPPWMPSNAEQCAPFKHSLKLKQTEIDMIASWVKAGTPAGDPKDATTFAPKEDKLAWVDAEVDIQTDYTPPATAPDDYHCFLTKPVLQGRSKELTGFQLIPGVREMVHHVLIYGVSPAYAKQLEDRNKSKHWPCGTGALFGGQAQLLGVWVPGTDVVRFPQDTGMTVNADSHLVLEFHYNLGTIKTPKADRTRIRVQFAREPVKYKLTLQLQLQVGIAIPPKAKDFVVSQTQAVPAPVRLWGIMPHMHKQGTKFSLTVQNPGTNKACMIDIPRWDYGWQQTFFFDQPGGLLLTGKEKILMKCTFDNPTDQTIRWGDRTGDEMCLNFYFISAP